MITDEDSSSTINQRLNTIEIRFLDSFQFLKSTLAALAKNLDGDCPILKIFYPNDFKLLCRKGIYFYDYFTSLEILKQKEFPKISRLFSKLTGERCCIKDYLHALYTYKHFNMKSLQEYHDLYLETDTLLLADVFEKFRALCLKDYGLDPVYYYTTPNMAWDALLKMTKINLELLTDIDMYLMFERSERGGISQVCAKRYSKSVGDISIKYFDANNLYGWAMAQKLPFGGFKWMTASDVKLIERDYIEGVPLECDGDIGYLIECDIEYTKEFHDKHKNLPLAAVKKIIN